MYKEHSKGPRHKPAPIPILVGRRTRAIRGTHSQDQLADAARRAGLDTWTRATIASLETGRRGLSAEELLLLPIAFGILTGRAHSLAELFDGPARFTRPNGSTAPTALLRSLVSGESVGPIGTRGYRGDVEHMAQRDAERKASESLKLSAELIADLSLQLFGRGLTEERERRLASRAGDASGRSLHALRGHVTRELLDEIEGGTNE